jgi:hypothetical protein
MESSDLGVPGPGWTGAITNLSVILGVHSEKVEVGVIRASAISTVP